MKKRIETYAEFWPFYLGEHSRPATRWMHALGNIAGIAVALFLMGTGQWNLVWLPFVIGYGLAWISHFFIEKNRPATFRYPWWSFISDFRMTFLLISGRL